MGRSPLLDLHPLTLSDIPDPESQAFSDFLDEHFDYGERLIESMSKWKKHSVKVNGTVQIINLANSAGCNEAKKELGLKEYWCGRSSIHTTNVPLKRSTSHRASSYNPMNLVRTVSRYIHDTPASATSPGPPEGSGRRNKPNGHVNGDAHDDHEEVVAPVPVHAAEAGEEDEVAKQAKVMKQDPHGLYERFRRGLLEYHSENEREYIESCRETECLEVFQPHVAEVWRLTYKTPPPTNPRTFVVLLLSRELRTDPKGQREFMNISIPFEHPKCPAKQGAEKTRVRGKYVSAERVRELDNGMKVEWKMATSSDAGGNIPRFMTNSSLPNSISEDVPSFLKWMVSRFPEGGEVDSHPAPQ